MCKCSKCNKDILDLWGEQCSRCKEDGECDITFPCADCRTAQIRKNMLAKRETEDLRAETSILLERLEKQEERINRLEKLQQEQKEQERRIFKLENPIKPINPILSDQLRAAQNTLFGVRVEGALGNVITLNGQRIN
jgi:hypothetical protein